MLLAVCSLSARSEFQVLIDYDFNQNDIVEINKATMDSLAILYNADFTGTVVVDTLQVEMSLDVDGVAQFLDSVLVAAGTPICLDSNVATNYIVFSTNLNIVGSADILIDPTGDDVLVDGGLTVGSTTEAGDNNLRVEGTYTGLGKFDNQWTATAGASVGNMYKTTLTAGDAFTGTTGHQFKVYDADATVDHNGGEHCAVYANMKLLSAMQAGGKSVIYSGHNYDSGIEIDAGVWLYGKLEDAFKVSGDTVGTGLDFSETVVENYEIAFSGGGYVTNFGDSIELLASYVLVDGILKLDTIEGNSPIYILDTVYAIEVNADIVGGLNGNITKTAASNLTIQAGRLYDVKIGGTIATGGATRGDGGGVTIDACNDSLGDGSIAIGILYADSLILGPVASAGNTYLASDSVQATGVVEAVEFVGALTGLADSATTAYNTLAVDTTVVMIGDTTLGHGHLADTISIPGALAASSSYWITVQGLALINYQSFVSKLIDDYLIFTVEPPDTAAGKLEPGTTVVRWGVFK